MNQEKSLLHKEFEGMQKYESIDRKLRSLQADAKRLDSEALELEVEMDQEQRDVERVEKGGFQTFLLKVVGKYEETRNKEVLEAAEARMKWQEKKNQLEEIHERIYELQKEQGEYRYCERNYNQLYEERLQAMMEDDSTDQKKILELRKENAISEHCIKEVKEAIAAGEKVLLDLGKAQENMKSAKNWGTYDLFGGGLAADIAKHNRIADAKSCIEQVQSSMRSYKTELADVKMVLDLQVEINGFDKFADFFFDGLLSNLNVQSKIKESIDSITKAIRDVESVQSQLRTLENQEKNRTHTRNRQIEEIVRES